jgi:hypothetical protein
MNATPRFRYYAAFVLILMLVLMLQVQVQPTGTSEQVEQATTSAVHYAAGSSASQ